MMDSNVESESVIPVLEVRVLDINKKTSFRLRRITEFPVNNTISELREALINNMPDVPHVDKSQFGYILERNKKFTIATDSELQKANEYFIAGYQMWLDPTPQQPSKKSSQAKSNPQREVAGCQVPQASHEEKITREISEIQKIHGTDLPPYKYRLWAEMIFQCQYWIADSYRLQGPSFKCVYVAPQLVGTASRDKLPDAPMFSATPAKRPRRENWCDKLTTVGETVAHALSAAVEGKSKTTVNRNNEEGNTDKMSKVAVRSEVIKQIREFFDLKQLGAITEDEYEAKKALLLQDIHV
ncbi:uncharacterized protein LOC114542659 isoform X1 [Dendronephthya gigantea]|uniref:uncharacterized protein LOC114542659 isoform X1 n=1 Tax=Dendronephthya gigantea TaxID=151771 RepID=UPI00106CC06A|nr:uncharacterized protein LOC114542659 isoform X1 [Dendronephthya gigantea]